MLEVNQEWIFRFPRRSEVERQLEKEIALLPELAPTLSFPIPQFVFAWDGGQAWEQPFVGYRKIPGIPLDEDLGGHGQSNVLAQQLARFLSELHSFSPNRAEALGVPSYSPAQWRDGYQEMYTRVQNQVFPLLSPSAGKDHRALWDGFLECDACLQFRPVLIHHDLGAEHILCDPEQGSISGIIDWGDAAVGDPALDFVGIDYSFGREFTASVLASYLGEVGEAFWNRVDFYVGIIPCYGVLYGLEVQDKRYVEHGLEMLERRK